MKRLAQISILALLALFLTPNVQAQSMEVIPEQEIIESFNTQITLNAKSFDVVETISYNFGLNFRHGIYRYIPIKYDNGFFNRGIVISNVDVLQDGEQAEFVKSTGGGNYNIKIGDAATVITGLHVYTIKYTVEGAYNIFDDHDELYWNVTGNGWEVPINSVIAKYIFSQPLTRSDFKTVCYQGVIGSTTQCPTSVELVNVSDEVVSSTFQVENLNINEGVTTIISLPKGFITITAEDKLMLFIQANGAFIFSLIFPILAFIIMLSLWLTKGRDQKGRGTVIPEYEAPDGISPVQVGTLHDFNIDNRDISAEIIFLAVNGYIKLERIEKSGLFDSVDYKLIQTNKDQSGLLGFQKKLIGAYFPGQANEILLSSLKRTISAGTFTSFKSQVMDSLIKNGYFKHSPVATRGLYIGIGTVIGFLGFYFFSGAATVSLIITALIICGFGYFMPSRTKIGAEALEKVNGLKWYIEVAEQKRIEFHDAPEKTPAHFQALLPFAMAFGLETKWAEYFKDVNIPQPDWYNGHGAVFNALILSNHMRGFNSSAAAVVAATQASKGGSGFSGGSSGGGFGGGGGGSW